MKAMVENNTFIGYNIGASNSVVVSHLSFADDTLLIWGKRRTNVRALRDVFLLFLVGVWFEA